MNIELVDCPACGNKVSSQAVACPHCGQPLCAEPRNFGPAAPRPAQSAGADAAEQNIRLIGILSIVSGVIGLLLFPVIFGPAGIILGVIAVRKQERSGWWGIGLGGIETVIAGVQLARLLM